MEVPSSWPFQCSGLFYDPESIQSILASNGRMTDEQKIGMNLEGSDRGLIEVLSGNYLEEQRKTTINFNWHAGVPGRT
jgi:hypothetical protein